MPELLPTDTTQVEEFFAWVTASYDADTADTCRQLVRELPSGQSFITEKLAWEAFCIRHKAEIILAERMGGIRFG